MMRFTFNEKKSAQAAAYLIDKAGGSINYMVLIKLLYLADRTSLIETGAPITGDRMVAMPHGPVLSGVLDLINMGEESEPGETSVWYDYVTEPADYVVSTEGKAQADFDELSRNDLRTLDAVFDEFGRLNKWALRDFTHTLAEWSDPKGSSIPIDPAEILRGAGYSETEIRDRVAAADELYVQRLLSTLHGR